MNLFKEMFEDASRRRRRIEDIPRRMLLDFRAVLELPIQQLLGEMQVREIEEVGEESKPRQLMSSVRKEPLPLGSALSVAMTRDTINTPGTTIPQ
ncbi:MAG: hypothetical protein Q9181_006463 [Wetmoreana brouardii]